MELNSEEHSKHFVKFKYAAQTNNQKTLNNFNLLKIIN
jgi:hypothetical protein